MRPRIHHLTGRLCKLLFRKEIELVACYLTFPPVGPLRATRQSMPGPDPACLPSRAPPVPAAAPPPGDDRCPHAAAHGHRHPAVSAVPSGAPPGHCPSLSLAAIVGAAPDHGSPRGPSAMTSLRHESGFRPSAWWVRGAVCAHAGPGPPLVASPSPLEDHQLLRTGPGLCPEASDDAFAPPLLLSQRVRLALQSPRRLA